jgi:hypothetical protein
MAVPAGEQSAAMESVLLRTVAGKAGLLDWTPDIIDRE